jgi:hypothetical protein
MDIIDIVENTKKIYMSENSLETLMDMERVLDALDLYAFKNWQLGELVEGPIKEAYWTEATFMWPYKGMPDPDGGKRLLEYKAKVEYIKDKLKTPVQIKDYDDFRPGTRKPKLRIDDVWLVKIRLPNEIISDVVEGYIEIEGREIDLSELDYAKDQGITDTQSMEMQINQGVAGEENV